MSRAFGTVRFLVTAAIFSGSLAMATECPRPVGTLRISAVGDILPHKVLYQMAVRHPQAFKFLWQDTIPVLKSADWTIGNLEGPVAPGVRAGGRDTRDVGFVYDGEVYSGTNFVFNFHPRILSDLKNSGFDFLSTANNHSLDRGALGVDRTVEQMDRAGMPFAGTRKRGDTASFERVVTVKGVRIGVISCTEHTNGWKDPASQVQKCQSASMITGIRALREKVDLVLILPHWGAEYQPRPHSNQVSWARRWVAAGADLIIGNHPHVLQTTEWIKANGRDTLVIYSLGNFIAAQKGIEKSSTAIAHVDIRPSPGGARVVGFSYTPVYRPAGSATLRFTRGKDVYQRSYEHVLAQMGRAVCAR